MSKIIYDEKNLNPTKNKQVEKMLKKGKKEQLWFFLHDSLPKKGKDISLIVTNKYINEDEYELPLMPYCNHAVDTLFYAETTDELKKAKLAHMLPYVPLIKHCYIPYACVYLILEDMSKDDYDKLEKLILHNNVLNASLEKTKDSIKLQAFLAYPGLSKETEVYISAK